MTKHVVKVAVILFCGVNVFAAWQVQIRDVNNFELFATGQELARYLSNGAEDGLRQMGGEIAMNPGGQYVLLPIARTSGTKIESAEEVENLDLARFLSERLAGRKGVWSVWVKTIPGTTRVQVELGKANPQSARLSAGDSPFP
ncbi:MAG TPA: hypothetical protein PKC28_16055 [Bdellovibrionales bacterium]|nr:hypothetical protein [Bdellovibrionales bacterium]